MPVEAFSIKRLNSLLGKKLTGNKLVEVVENLGCDVEGMDHLILQRCPNCKNLLERLQDALPLQKCRECGFEQEKAFEEVEKSEVIRLNLLAARADLLDVAGLCRALKGYLGIEDGLPEYNVQPSDWEVIIEKDRPPYRPFIQCALVDLEVDTQVLREIMRLQESLHWAVGRDRKLSSIGVYDLSLLKSPIRYTSEDKKFSFCPLGMPEKKMSCEKILESHPKGIDYAHLLQGQAKYPILVDSKGQVLSMPPIINSDETKVKEGSKNLFVDVTGTDERPVRDTLNNILTSLMEMGGKVKSVSMKEGKKSFTTPNLEPGKIQVNYERSQSWIGKEYSLEEFKNYLKKMRLSVKSKGNTHTVYYPVYRSDIKHEVDIFEDIAIAIGYQNLTHSLVPTMTVGEERKEEILSNRVRQAMTGLGYMEVMSLMQTTEERHFRFLNLPAENFVQIANPKTVDQNVLRCHMMTGILEIFQKNRIAPKPQKFFEVGNVVLLDPSQETGTREERRMIFGFCDKEAGYADGRAILDTLFRELQISGVQYSALQHPSLIPGRAASVKGGSMEGTVGEIHPEVLHRFEIPYPLVMGEIKLMDLVW